MDLLFRVSTVKGYMVSWLFTVSLCTFVRTSSPAQATHSLTLMSAWAPKFDFTWVATLFALRPAACSSSVVMSVTLPVENPPVLLELSLMSCVLGWCFQPHAGGWDCLAGVHAAVCNVFLQHAKLPVGLTFTNQMPSDLLLLPFKHFLCKPFTLRVSLQPCWLLSVSEL